MTTELTVVFEDEFILVVDKPSGLLMHPSWLDKHETDTLVKRVKHYALSKGEAYKVHTVHRLDRPTSGLVVISKSLDCARHLSNQFLEHHVEKRYWAIVRGYVDLSITVDYPLIEPHDKIADSLARTNKPAQDAITHFHRIAQAEMPIPVDRYESSRFSWVSCFPKTGRKHQIRRHLKHIRHPIIGDSRYGCRHHTRAAAEHFHIRSLALRAVELRFNHPNTGERLVFVAPKSAQWAGWLTALGWDESLDDRSSTRLETTI